MDTNLNSSQGEGQDKIKPPTLGEIKLGVDFTATNKHPELVKQAFANLYDAVEELKVDSNKLIIEQAQQMLVNACDCTLVGLKIKLG